MLKINFSDIYDKLLDEHCDVIEIATLMGVYEINLEEQHEAFLLYDTNNGKYKLPKKGKYLMLLFEKINVSTISYETGRNLFTTLRRYTPRKAEYYKSHIGEEFNINITQRAADLSGTTSKGKGKQHGPQGG